jgi:hypothetical protein
MYIITPTDLTTAGISINTIKSAVHRGRVAKANHGEYVYNSIPDTWKESLKLTLWGGLEPDVWQAQQRTLALAAKQTQQTDASVEALRAVWVDTLRLYEASDAAYLTKLKPRAGKLGLPKGWVYEISRAAALLTVLCDYDTPTAVRAAFGEAIGSKAALRDAALRLIWAECGWELRHADGKHHIYEPEDRKDTLKGCRIHNVQVLQRAERAFKEALTEELPGVPAHVGAAKRRENALQSILKRLKLGNQNTRKVGRKERKVLAGGKFDAQEALIYTTVANLGGSVVLNVQQAYYQYVAQCMDKKVQPVTQSTFRHYATDPKVEMLIAKERLGAKRSNDLYTPYVSAARSQYGNSVVAMDGWVPEIPYRTTLSNGTTEVRQRLSVVFIVDHATSCPIGWEIAATETGATARAAMRRMLALNGGRAAREIIMDNGSAFGSKLSTHTLRVVADKLSPIAVGNSQENPAEAYIRMHLKAALATVEGFVGGNMSSKHTDAPNPDYYPKTKNLPTFDELKSLLNGVLAKLAAEIGDDGMSRRERYLATLHPDCRVIHELEQRAAFCHRLGPIEVQRGELVLQFGQVMQVDARRRPVPIKHRYMVPVDEMLAIDPRNKRRVVVVFDEEHPETVDLYNYNAACPTESDGDSYITTVSYKPLASKGFAEATAETRAALGKMLAEKDAFKAKQDAFVEDLVQANGELDVADLFEDPELVLAVPFSGDKKRFKTEYNDAELTMLLRKVGDDGLHADRNEAKRRQAVAVPSQENTENLRSTYQRLRAMREADE